MDNQTPQNSVPNTKKSAKGSERRAQLLGLRIMGDFSATIAIPIVLLSWLGKRLDTRAGTAPIFLIAGFILAFTLSAISIYRKAKQYAKLYKDI
ncbi:MAG: AtpZ/AtpI family protein [Candidatus Magasanikbacteria bacterium]|nr:AtpZ/AtpI family protein [Candidatus Magasanikbacteria bacterium]